MTIFNVRTPDSATGFTPRKKNKEITKTIFAGLGFAAFWVFAAGIDSIVDALLKAF